MPVEIGLEMWGEGDVVLPPFTGYISRGLLLHILRRVDPRVSADLHAPDVVKPYSVTPLKFRSKVRAEAGYVLDSGFPCRVWFRFLRDELAQYVIRYFCETDRVMIIDRVFRISSLSVKSKGYEELEQGAEHPVELFRLYFRTPTYLASLGTPYHYLFPDPLKVFPALMRLWNSFTTTKKFTKTELLEYREWLTKNMGVSEHKLKTCLVHIGEKKIPGFVGWTTYEMGVQDKWNKTTCVLAKFAEYSNLGGNRTGGFGVTKYQPKT